MKYYLTLYNHWSYIGIGWSLGIESCIQSVEDSLQMAELPPHVPVGINMDAEAFVIMAKLRPDLMRKLKLFCDTGRAEIVGGSYSQPLGSMIGGESNIRQLLLGRQRIREATGITVDTFLEEEEFSHPQLPQILRQCGFTGASISQCDTWGYAGVPESPHSAIYWQGVDGSKIRCATQNTFHFHPPCVTAEVDTILQPERQKQLQEMARQDGFAPLIQVWTEFGWEKIDGQMINKFDRKQYVELKQRMPVEFCSLSTYLKQIPEALPIECYAMDDFSKMLAWGIGGDQLRKNDRKGEQMLLALETLDALLRLSDISPEKIDFNSLWEDLLAAQSHDVSLCEFSRWQGGMPPEEAFFPPQFQTWGAIGMARQQRCIQTVRMHTEKSMLQLAEQIGGVVVLNPSSAGRNGAGILVNQPLPENPAIVFSDGAIRPIQKITAPQEHGKAVFESPDIPGWGWVSGHLISAPATPATPLRVNGEVLENDLIRIRIRPSDGRIAELFDKKHGHNLLDEEYGFGHIQGEFKQAGQIDRILFDNAVQPHAIIVEESGPVRGSVKVQWLHAAAVLEMTVTLYAHADFAEISLRLKTHLPPVPEVKRSDSWQLVHEPQNGVWLHFKSAFSIDSTVRDYPFGISETKCDGFSALTLADFRGNNVSLSITHGGTQYWRKQADGRRSNLLMREWENGFTGQAGWPIYSEYHYRLQPGTGQTPFRILAQQSEFAARDLLVGVSAQVSEPAWRQILQLQGSADAVMLRHDASSERIEFRTVEYNGEPGELGLATGKGVCPKLQECNFEGGPLPHHEKIRALGIQAWRL